MKFNVKSNADQLVKKFEETVDLVKDFRPVLLQIMGKDGDRRSWTLIGDIHRQFITQGRAWGPGWKDLTPTYAKYKAKKFAGKSILIRTGTLFNSLVFGGPGAVRVLSNKKLVFGTSVPYAIYHNSSKARTKMPYRPFMRFGKAQSLAAKKLIAQYIKDAWNNKAVKK